MTEADANGWMLIPDKINLVVAPFDGTPVILGWVRDYHPRSAWWDRVWVFASAAGGPITIAPGALQPTHWQPLPKPPVQP